MASNKFLIDDHIERAVIFKHVFLGENYPLPDHVKVILLPIE